MFNVNALFLMFLACFLLGVFVGLTIAIHVIPCNRHKKSLDTAENSAEAQGLGAM